MLGKLTTKSIVAKLKIPKTHGKRAQRTHRCRWMTPVIISISGWMLGMCVVFRWMAVIRRRKHIIISPLRINRQQSKAEAVRIGLSCEKSIYDLSFVSTKNLIEIPVHFEKTTINPRQCFVDQPHKVQKPLNITAFTHPASVCCTGRSRDKQKEFHQWPKMAYSACPHRVLHRRMRGAMEKKWRSGWWY